MYTVIQDGRNFKVIDECFSCYWVSSTIVHAEVICELLNQEVRRRLFQAGVDIGLDVCWIPQGQIGNKCPACDAEMFTSKLTRKDGKMTYESSVCHQCRFTELKPIE